MSMKDKTIVVTGGSRGLGLGLVEALAEQGAKVTIVARDATALAAARRRFGVETIAADVAEEGAAQRILAEVRPEILVLNAGAVPRMGRLDQLSWADFTVPWETDVKAGLYWIQAALNLPLAAGRARARRLQRRGAAGLAPLGRLRRSQTHALDHGEIRQWRCRAKGAEHPVPGHRAAADHRRYGVGDEASTVYARAMGVEREAFLKRFGAPMPPRKFGDHVVALLENPQYSTGVAFGLKGDTGITVLEEDAA